MCLQKENDILIKHFPLKNHLFENRAMGHFDKHSLKNGIIQTYELHGGGLDWRRDLFTAGFELSVSGKGDGLSAVKKSSAICFCDTSLLSHGMVDSVV